MIRPSGPLAATPNADEFDPSSDDPTYKFVAPEDGTYRLLVRDQFGDGRQVPSFVYRLAIHGPQPDFRIVAYPTSPPPTQQQIQQTPLATASIRRGGTIALALVVQRRDEFDGEISVSAEGLPAGVTCPGAVLGGGVSEGSLVFIAAEDASAWAGPIKITAKAKIGEREATREARYGVRRMGHCQPPAAAERIPLGPRPGARRRQRNRAGPRANRRRQGL